jgi:uncharacterized protein YbjT (DUF2867 family)
VKVIVIGGTGRIGSGVVQKLGERGHEAVPASPELGVNTITSEGLPGALEGSAVVVDVTNSPVLEGEAVLRFFETSTRNLIDAERSSGVGHHVALSVVGTDRLLESSYFQGKIAQEELIQGSPIPYTIVRATQFFEFIHGIAEGATDGDTARVAPVWIQPMAADDVATAVAKAAAGPPANGIVEVAGPERVRLDELIRRDLAKHHDPRHVVADPAARYFGASLDEGTLVPGDDAILAETRYDDWFDRAD